MTVEPAVEGLEGLRMSDAEVDAFLTEQGDGVLALADGGDAYAVPISFGYDAGTVYFVFFRFAEEPKKEAYSRATETACLAVYEATSPERWRSVLVTGPLEAVGPDRWGEVGTAMGDNAWSPDLSTIGPRQQLVQAYVLPIEAATGMKGRAYA